TLGVLGCGALGNFSAEVGIKLIHLGTIVHEFLIVLRGLLAPLRFRVILVVHYACVKLLGGVQVAQAFSGVVRAGNAGQTLLRLGPAHESFGRQYLVLGALGDEGLIKRTGFLQVGNRLVARLAEQTSTSCRINRIQAASEQ